MNRRNFLKFGAYVTGAVTLEGLLTGCGGIKQITTPEIMRNNTTLLKNKGTTLITDPVRNEFKESDYKNVINLVQAIGEDKSISDLNLPSSYYVPGISEQKKEEIAFKVVKAYDPLSFQGIVINYKENKATEKMYGRFQKATKMDLTSTAVWTTAIGFGLGYTGGSSSSSASAGTSKTFGTGTSTNTTGSGF